MTSRQRMLWEKANPLQGPPLTIVHDTGTLTVLPGGTAAAIRSRLEEIESERPPRRREPRQQPGQPLPIPKRAPRYIGRERNALLDPYFPNPSAERPGLYTAYSLRPSELFIEKTIGGEPWVAAYWRMFYQARDSGFYTR